MANCKGIGCGAAIILSFLLIIVFASLDKKPQSQNSPSPSTAPVVPKAQLPPQEKDYLQKASGFLINNHEADKEMTSAMQRAKDKAITIDEIRMVIKASRSLNTSGFAIYQTAHPPASYKKIDSKIRNYAKIRNSAFDELTRGFGSSGLFVPKGGLPHVERGSDQFVESVRQGGLCLQELNKRLADLKAKVH